MYDLVESMDLSKTNLAISETNAKELEICCFINYHL